MQERNRNMSYDFLFMNVCRRYRRNKKNSGEVLGQYILATLLEDNGYGSRVYTGYTSEVESVLNYEIKENDVKVVGLYCDYDNETEVTSIANYIKNKYDVKVVVGGPESIVLEEDFLYKSCADMIVEGEGEVSILQIAKYYIDRSISIEDINNIKYLDENKNFIKNEHAHPIMNLDDIPIPRYEVALNKSFRKGDTVSILTGRGCPFSCSFCYEGENTKLCRYRSVENVLEEIDYILENNKNLKYILFVDDTFTIDIQRVRDICSGIKERNKKYDFKWYCEAHVNTLYKTPEIIKEMVECGLVRLQLGVESANDEVLKLYNKNISKEKIIQVLDYCKEFGVKQVVTNIIIGGAGETEKTFEESLEFSKKLIEKYKFMIDIHSVFFAPYPNTKITNAPDLFDMNIIDSRSMESLLSMERCVVETKELSRVDIEDLRKRFTKEILEKMHEEINYISESQVISMMDDARYNVNSYWFEQVKKKENIMEYIYLRGLDTFKNYSELDIDEFIVYKPIRLKEVDEIFNLSKLQSEILRFSTGKLSNIDIINLLINKFNYNKDYVMKKYIEEIKNLEKMYLVIFSKY